MASSVGNEVVGVPVSQSARHHPAPVVGVPISQGLDEFDDGYSAPPRGASGSPNYRPVQESRSEVGLDRAPSNSSVYGNNTSFGEASPGGGYTYTSSGNQEGSGDRGRSSGGTLAEESKPGTIKRTIKISATEIKNWEAAFNVTQEIVIMALKESRGDRDKTVELLQLGPNYQPQTDGSNVTVKRNVIRITQQEITGFAKMFNATEARVIEVMREVKGDRDMAISQLSGGAGLPPGAPAGFGSPTYYSPTTTSNTNNSTNTNTNTGRSGWMSLEEANQLAAVFGVSDRSAEVKDIVEQYGSDRDVVMNKLENLASQPPQARPQQYGSGNSGGGNNGGGREEEWPAPNPNLSSSPDGGRVTSGEGGGGGGGAPPIGASMGGSANAWDGAPGGAPAPNHSAGLSAVAYGGLNTDDIEMMADDDFLGGGDFGTTADQIGGTAGGAGPPTQNYDHTAGVGAAGRSAADVDADIPDPASPNPAQPTRGNLPSAPGSYAEGYTMGNRGTDDVGSGGHREQMLPPAPGTW